MEDKTKNILVSVLIIFLISVILIQSYYLNRSIRNCEIKSGWVSNDLGACQKKLEVKERDLTICSNWRYDRMNNYVCTPRG